MPIELKDLYSQAFEAHRHASDYRAKIVGGWAAMYTAFAGLFVWVRSNHRESLRGVAVAAGVLTLLIWLSDMRNRPAIRRAKAIGKNIEEAPISDIPEARRFFATLDQGVSHSAIIDGFAILTLGMLLAGACLL